MCSEDTLKYLRKVRDQKEAFRQRRVLAITQVVQKTDWPTVSSVTPSPSVGYHHKFPSCGSPLFSQQDSIEADLKRHMVGYFSEAAERISSPTDSGIRALYARDGSPLRGEAKIAGKRPRHSENRLTWDFLLRQKAAEKMRKSPNDRDLKKEVNIHVKRSERKVQPARKLLGDEGTPRLRLMALAPVSLRSPRSVDFS